MIDEMKFQPDPDIERILVALGCKGDSLYDLLIAAEALRAEVADLHNGINWQMTCTNCAKLMNDNYNQYCEIERLRAVLSIIDNDHTPEVDIDPDSYTMGGSFCSADDEPWPCSTHLLLHPEETRRG